MHSFYRDPARRPFGGVGRKKHARMHTCIQKATQHVTTHRHAVTRPCPRALSSPVSARARPLCLLPSVLQSGRRRGSRRAAAATSPTRADLPRPRRWRGQACTAGAGPRGREGRHAEGTREAEEAARASRTGRRGAWHHLQRVHDRLGARSSAMTKATTQPAVRAEGRSPRRARSPPAWRIETRASELHRRSRARVDGPGR